MPTKTRPKVTKSNAEWLMRPNEVRCASGEAHLGHVFLDGPAPTAWRYCLKDTVLKLDQDHG